MNGAPDVDAPVIVSKAVPVFVSVVERAGAVPMSTFPKARDVGENEAAGVPDCTPVPVSGIVDDASPLPKATTRFCEYVVALVGLNVIVKTHVADGAIVEQAWLCVNGAPIVELVTVKFPVPVFVSVVVIAED